jgi:hypothetical protein
VRGELRGLPETLAEIFYPLLGLLPRHAYLRLFDALFAVGAVPEFPELRACLCVQYGLHRFFDGLTTPVRPDLRFSANFACTEFLDPLCARTCYNCNLLQLYLLSREPFTQSQGRSLHFF